MTTPDASRPTSDTEPKRGQNSLTSHSMRVAQQREPSRGCSRAIRDRENFLVALTRIEERIARVIAAPREGFYDGSTSYDAASLAVIRLQALREVPEFQTVFLCLSDEESRGLTAMRNIASHSGYDAMDDEVLWAVITEQLPALVPRLREAALEHFASLDQSE